MNVERAYRFTRLRRVPALIDRVVRSDLDSPREERATRGTGVTACTEEDGYTTRRPALSCAPWVANVSSIVSTAPS